MPQSHPGIIRDQNDPKLPLKAVRISPPHENQFNSQGKYLVFVELSREPNAFERLLLAEAISGSRHFGKTLEFSQTTIEEVSARAPEITQGLADVEKQGLVAAEAHEVENRRWEAEAAKEAAELERVRRIAAETIF